MTVKNTLKHLLPKGEAWSLTSANKTLRKFLDGVKTKLDLYTIAIADEVATSRVNKSANYVADAEATYGVIPRPTETASQRWDRINNIDSGYRFDVNDPYAGSAQLSASSPYVLQQVLWAEGFPLVRLYDYLSSGIKVASPSDTTDPTKYVPPRRVGNTFVANRTSSWYRRCSIGKNSAGTAINVYRCRSFKAGDAGYLVNEPGSALTYPPAFPTDPYLYRNVIYAAGATLNTPLPYVGDELERLDRLLLTICPADKWIVRIITSNTPGAVGLPSLTSSGAYIMAAYRADFAVYNGSNVVSSVPDVSGNGAASLVPQLTATGTLSATYGATTWNSKPGISLATCTGLVTTDASILGVINSGTPSATIGIFTTFNTSSVASASPDEICGFNAGAYSSYSLAEYNSAGAFRFETLDAGIASLGTTSGTAGSVTSNTYRSVFVQWEPASLRVSLFSDANWNASAYSQTRPSGQFSTFTRMLASGFHNAAETVKWRGAIVVNAPNGLNATDLVALQTWCI